MRVLSATNIDIAREVARGAFREDLLYRLNTVEIHLPPLRDRREDIVALACTSWSGKRRATARGSRKLRTLRLARSTAHDWPGNVRELEHVTERAIVLAENETIDVGDLSLRRAVDAGSISSE